MDEPEAAGVGHPLFRLWTGWLAAMAICVAAGGLLLSLFPSSVPIRWAVTRPIDPAFFPPGTDLSQLEAYREWLYEVLGASLAGWGGLMAFVVLVPFRAGHRWAWTALASTLMVWFLLDTFLSLAHGVGYNALLNTILLSGFALPLLASRRFFLGPSRTRNLERSSIRCEPPTTRE